uniref:Transmembrane protein 168 n=1 Tax=Chinchilla lanigera TaxID=34839 RepID=A0A8C2UR76_CHILA
MCKSLRYCFSLCLYPAMTRLEEVNREGSMHSSVLYLGLYVWWEKTVNNFCSKFKSLQSFFFFFFGFLLGLPCFLDNSSFKNDVKEESTKYLLLTSIILRILCAFVERISSSVRHLPTLLTRAEFLELVGFAIASTTLLAEKSLSVILLVVALARLITDLRRKSFLRIPNLVIFAALLFFSLLETPPNALAFAVFFICLITDPSLDIYYTGLSVTERWKLILYRGKVYRRLSVVFSGMIELTYFILSAFKLRDAHLWYLVIPGFSIFGIIWMIFHIIFLLNIWGFQTKLNGCHKGYFAHMADHNSLGGIMASKGMHHSCLISEQLVFFSFLATDTLRATSWQPTKGIFLSMFLIVFPLESMAPGLFHELPTLLPPQHIQELNLRSTGICDCSTSGLSFDTLHSKLKAFLELWTGDGPRHDTYLLYYSRNTHEKNGSFCSRLIIILDTENSTLLVKELRKVNDQFIAVQEAEIAKTVDIKEAHPPQLGDFTKDWIKHNCNPSKNISWTEKAVYGVSKRWSEYTLHLPTGSDVAKHWMLSFPCITHPLAHLANWLCGLNLFWICKTCFRCLK